MVTGLVAHRVKAITKNIWLPCLKIYIAILASVLRLLIFKELMRVVIDIRYLKLLEIMSKLIWQLYNDNMISYEVANLLLDKHYNRLEHKRYK